ncbi:MAG: hypothetical protein RL360_225 [Bacteroidota bacterium]|jgi:hypothetical protein
MNSEMNYFILLIKKAADAAFLIPPLFFIIYAFKQHSLKKGAMLPFLMSISTLYSIISTL